MRIFIVAAAGLVYAVATLGLIYSLLGVLFYGADLEPVLWWVLALTIAGMVGSIAMPEQTEATP